MSTDQYIKYALFTVNKQALYDIHTDEFNDAFKYARRNMFSKYISEECKKVITLTADPKLKTGYYRAPADLITWYNPQPTDSIIEDGEKLYKISPDVEYIYDSEIISDLYLLPICTAFLIDVSIKLGLISGELNILQAKLMKQESDLNESIKRSDRLKAKQCRPYL